MEVNNEINMTETWRQEETGILDIKKEFSEEDCPTVSLLDNLGEETGTLNIKKEFSEEDCPTVSLLNHLGQDTGTFDIKKEFSEEDCPTVSLPESREDTGTLDIKKEFSEEDCPTVSVLNNLGIETGTLDIKKELPEEDCPTISLLESRDDTGTFDIQKEFSEEDCCTVNLPKSREDTGTLDINKEFSEEDCPTVSILDSSGEETGTLDIKKELSQEDCSTYPVTPIMSCIDNPVDSGVLDTKVEISEPDCITASSKSISRTDKPEGTGKLADKIQCAKKRATFISTPIIFLPDNVIEDINKFDIKVKFADQDWSTVPSTPKKYLPGQKNVSGISKINSKPTNHISQALLSLTEMFPGALNAINPKLGLQTSLTNAPKSTSTSADKPNCIEPAQKNVEASIINEQRTVISKKKKLSTKSKRKRAALIAHGIPEEIAKALCMLPLPSLMEMFPGALNAINPKLGLQTPLTNAPKSTSSSADKPSCMEQAQKNVAASIINEQRTVISNNTTLRVGIQNAKPMDKAQMTMVHRRLVSAITKVGKGSSGPGFLNFQQMDGWIMVTCVDHRSRAWLVGQLKHLELWPGAQLSIMSEQLFSKQAVNKVIAFIPESEATNVQEALTLLKAQNKGLNTQQWKMLNERLEIGKSWSILFIIDEPSLETLKTQYCQAAIGFKRMTFRIITASGVPINNSKSQFSKNQGQSSSQSSKGTSQKPPFSSAGHEISVGPGVGTNPVESQNLILSQSALGEKGGGAVSQRGESSNSVTAKRKSDGKNNSCTRPIRSKEPSTLAATGRPMLRAGGDSQSVIKDSRTENSSRGEPVTDKPKILAIEHIFHAAKDRIEERRQYEKTQTREHILRAAKDRIEQLRQKTQIVTTISEQNGSQSVTTRWDEPPTHTGRKRPLAVRDRDTARPIIDNTKRQREETSTSAGEKRIPAARDYNKATPGGRRNEAQRISQNSQGIIGIRAPFVQDKMANRIGTDRVKDSSQTTRGNPAMMLPTFVTSGVDAPTAVTLGRSVTGDITVTQLNGVSAPIASGSGMATNYNGFYCQTINGNLTMVPPGYGVPTAIYMGSGGTGGITLAQQNEGQTSGGNIAVAPIVIPGYRASSVVNLATSGTDGITVTPQNIPMMPQSMVVPGYGATTMANLATGAGGITESTQNKFSTLGSEMQAMDYFLGPGGGNQFVQNQMMFQSCLSYGNVASQQTALGTMYPMYPNQQYNINCYQAPQNGMSTFNQDNSQKDSTLAQMPMDNEESEASRDSDASRSRDDSEEGFYRSWIIQDADSFAASIAERNALNAATGQKLPLSTSGYGAQTNEDPNKRGIPSFAQDSSRSYLDTHSRSFKERLPTQSKDHQDLYDRYSPSMSYRSQSPQGRGDRTRDVEDENYENSPSREERCDRDRLLREARSRSPQTRSGYSAWIIEDVENYGRNRNSREKSDDRDRPLRPDRMQQAGSKRVYSDWDAEKRNSREKEDDRDRSSKQERNYYKGLVKEDTRSCDRSQSSGMERNRDRLRSDRRSPQKRIYERRQQDAKRDNRSRSRDKVTWDSSSKRNQRSRERDGYRNRRDGLPREPGYQRDWRHEVRPRR